MAARYSFVIALLLSASCKQNVEKEKPPAQVQVTSVAQATIRRIVQGDGALFPIEQASIMSKISAPVRRFYVNRGDHVRRGQLVAVLENRDLVSAANESKAAVTQAQSNLRTTEASTVPDAIVKAQTDLAEARQMRESARKILESRRQLFQQGALAGRLVDESQAAFNQAESQLQAAQEHLRILQTVRSDQIKGATAQVESARAHLETEEAQVSYTQIESPISGIVADRPVSIGEIAGPGAPLLTVVGIGKVVARVNVPQTEASNVRIGQIATLTQPDAREEVRGKVTVVSPASDPNTTTVQVWIEIDNPSERLKSGTAVHAAIATEVFRAATVVPYAAILPGEEGGTSVLTVSADSVVHRRKTAIGVQQGDHVQVLSGVSPGEEVVVVGGVGLDDNAKVKIVTTSVEESEDADQNDPDDRGAKTPKQEPAKSKPE